MWGGGSATYSKLSIFSKVVVQMYMECHSIPFSVKVKVKVKVYSLVSNAKRHSPDFTQLPPGHRTCSFISHLNFPGSIQADYHFRRTELFKTHKPSLSYQVPTYSWVERVHV